MNKLLQFGVLILVGSGFALAEEPTATGPAVAQLVSENAMILRRPLNNTKEGSDQWSIVKKNEGIPAGSTLLGLPGAHLLSKNGAVEIHFQTDLLGRSPFPVKESVILLPAKPGTSDLDFTLDRGRIQVINKKTEGAAHIVMTVHGEPWEITLNKPGTRFVAELFGRWPAGVPFTTSQPNQKDQPVPSASMILVALEGDLQVKHGGLERGMEAPPGPALIVWDNKTGSDRSAQKLERLPIWVEKSPVTPEITNFLKIREKFRSQLEVRPIGEILDELARSEDATEQRFAINAMGALDDLPRLAQVLGAAHSLNVWENAVLVLRHWIGRGPGQDQKLYDRLVNVRKLSPAQAETLMGLLHSFGEDELAHKETYQVLVRYLNNDVLGIRGLANWHLTRLYPEGKKFGYDPLASPEEREKAQKLWNQVIQDGLLPPKKKPA